MRIILFIIINIIFAYTASAQEFSVSPPSKAIDIEFDSPKGDRSWTNPYIREFDISITNELNATLTVSVSAFSYDTSYISLSSSRSSLNIPALRSDSVKITVKIADSAADGGRYSGRVRLTGDFQTKYVDVYVNTFHPPPTLILSGNFDFGEVVAGKSYSESFTLKEQLKFKKAKNVEVKLNEEGPVYNAAATPYSFYEVDSYGKTITFSFSVKDRGLVPGIYSPDIRISSSNDASLIGGSLRYTIPKPEVGVSIPQIGITFDYGRSEIGSQRIIITESGSKTPLENTKISFERLTREFNEVKENYNADWFKFPASIDYIAPGNSKNIDIEVIKPEEAPTGNYTWVGDIKTVYAGKKKIQFSIIVRPPEIEDIKNNLTKFMGNQLVRDYPDAENLVKTTGSLLSKDEKQMADMANVTSLINVVIKFSNSMNAAYLQYGKSDYNGAYEEFRAGKEEIDELNDMKLKQIYNQESSDIKNFANRFWKEFAVLLISGLKQNANWQENPYYQEASYAEAKKSYEKISEICSWLGNTSCMQEHNTKVVEMDKKIKQLISESMYLENETDKMQDNIHYNSWSLSGTRLIKNPLKFFYFLEIYDKIIENYGKISKNYKLSGESKGFENAQVKLADLKKESDNFKFANIIYIIILGFILTLMTWTSIQGFIRYRADAKDVRLSEIVRTWRSERQ